MTSRRLAPVTTGQIYWGSVPFVAIQLIMVAAVITFPSLVLAGLDTGPKIDPNKVKIEIQQPDQSDTDQPLQIETK